MPPEVPLPVLKAGRVLVHHLPYRSRFGQFYIDLLKVSVNGVDIPFFGWGSEAIERFSVFKQTRSAFNNFYHMIFPT